jgi:hypothetical protein
MYQVLCDKLGFVSIVVSICVASALKARRAVPAGTAGILLCDDQLDEAAHGGAGTAAFTQRFCPGKRPVLRLASPGAPL